MVTAGRPYYGRLADMDFGKTFRLFESGVESSPAVLSAQDSPPGIEPHASKLQWAMHGWGRIIRGSASEVRPRKHSGSKGAEVRFPWA
jgi:hypothetical protein